jgi:tripartite-type tricarboxylate transporter receptor subunit TctC
MVIGIAGFAAPTFPSDLPTIGETVPGYEVSVWNGIVAPKGTSPEIVAKLNQALNAGMQEAKNYRRYAEECERWAKTMTEESRRTLQIADALASVGGRS